MIYLPLWRAVIAVIVVAAPVRLLHIQNGFQCRDALFQPVGQRQRIFHLQAFFRGIIPG